MEEKNKKSTIEIILITVAITLTIALGVVYFVFLRKTDEASNNNDTNISSYYQETYNNINKEVKKMGNLNQYIAKIKNEASSINAMVTYEIIKNESLPKTVEVENTSDSEKPFKYVLSADGKISIKGKNGEKELTNISNVKNICYLPMSDRVYILLGNGDVYAYLVSSYNDGEYQAFKINAVKNAVNFVDIRIGYDEAGADFDIGVIDSNNDYYWIDAVGI